MSRQNRTGTIVVIAVGVGVALGATTPAFAQSVSKLSGDFYGGMLRPVTAMEHLFPIIALGLLAGQQGAKRARWVLLVFPAALLVGAIVGCNAAPNEYVVWINRLSFVALGLSVAAALRLPLAALLAISFLFGVTHGYENTADMSQSVALHVFLPGMVASGLALVAVGAAVAVALKVPWQQIVVRVVGSWIAAIGLLIIGAWDSAIVPYAKDGKMASPVVEAVGPYRGDRAGHKHAAQGPHGGGLIDLGKGEYHAELGLDERTGMVTVHLLDGAAKQAASVALREIAMEVDQGGESVKYALRAMAVPADPQGTASRFAIVDSTLCDRLCHEELARGRLQMTIDGRQYASQFECRGHHHEGHGP